MLFAVVYLRFFWHLPRRTQLHFATAAVLFVGGALGLEMVTGYFLTTYEPGIQTGITAILEESLEFAGALIFLYGLLVYLRALTPELTLRLSS